MQQLPLKTMIALLMTLFLVGCATVEKRAVDAAREQGALQASRHLPEYPDDCRSTSRSGVRQGERLDVALLRMDRALTQQNARTLRCAGWYDNLKGGIQKEKLP